LSEHPDVNPPGGELAAQERRVPAPGRRRRENSMQQVATRLSKRLEAHDEAERARIRRAVLDIGRTQAWNLATEALSLASAEELPVDRFFQLVETRGVRKERPAYIQQALEAHLSTDSVKEQETSTLIAEQLGEHGEIQWQAIYMCVKALGIETALSLLQRTQEIEAAGGMMLPDQTGRKTPGGVFFWLVRKEAPADLRSKIFHQGYRKRASMAQQATPTPKLAPRLPWEDRARVLADAGQQKGEIKTVKITLVGRPGNVAEQDRCIVISMQQAAKIPPLPAGLPLPPVEQVGATTYNVYIASKQWRKVAEAIKDIEDILIVEGLPFLDGEQIAVLASNVTTRNLQKARSSKPRPAEAGASDQKEQTDRVP
jgi:hypothetical protein